MAAVARRKQINGANGEREGADNRDHDLGDLDAALLQIFIAKRVLNLDDAQNILGALANVTSMSHVQPTNSESNMAVDQDSFEEAVHRLNTVIHDFDLEIRKTLDQSNGSPLWAIVYLPK
jgi:Nse1 non-SMC component of SMC5-6 complex